MAETPQKSSFRISEVCEVTDTQPYVLRFWESEFPQLSPEKNSSGQRIYSRDDVDLILRIKQLLYDEEYTIAAARDRLEQERRGRARRAVADRQAGQQHRGGDEGKVEHHFPVEAERAADAAFRATSETVERERYENAVREIQRLRLDQTRLREERDEQAARTAETERVCADLRRRFERTARRLEALLARLAAFGVRD